MPPCNTASASGHRPTRPRTCPIAPCNPPPMSPSASSPLPVPALPPPFITPPSRYFGYNTCRIFSHTASRSRRSVSHTVSSMVLSGARRSSPAIAELRYPCAEPAARWFELACEEVMVPVRGARSEVEAWLAGSSRSSRVAGRVGLVEGWDGGVLGAYRHRDRSGRPPRGRRSVRRGWRIGCLLLPVLPLLLRASWRPLLGLKRLVAMM